MASGRRHPWLCEARDVIHPVETRVRVAPVNLAALTASTLPGEADAVKPIAAELEACFAKPDATDDDRVKGQAA